MSAVMLRQLCTTSLYRDRSGVPNAQLQADLETIQRLAAEAAS